MRHLLLLSVTAIAVPVLAHAQQDYSKVEVKATRLADGLHVLFGAGGNVAVSSGPDGVFLVDDQYAPMTPKIKAAVAAISDKPIRFVLNTHWHGDHTGGNENLGGAGSLIVAHDNVRRRMSTEQFIAALDRKVPPSPPVALPVVTFSDDVTFHLNGDEIHCFHVLPAHTDGDSIVHFRRANAIHMGDLFFNGMYPFIDFSTGGNMDGIVDAADRALALANDTTHIIPGHGEMGTKADLKAFRDMIASVRDRVRALISEGKNLAEIQAAKPTAAFDEKWGKGFLKPDAFVALVHSGLARR